MILSLLLIAAAMVLLLPSAVNRYRAGLPDAPRCPDCRAYTTGSKELWSLISFLPGLADTVRRECLRCGWRGRMRLRLAPDGAHGG
jgi:hypothetical protein